MAGTGVYLLFGALAGVPPRDDAPSHRPFARSSDLRTWLTHAGLDGVRPSEFVAAVAVLMIVGAATVFALFGGPIAALLGGMLAGVFPVATYRRRGAARRAKAMDAWPRLIEEIRILTSSSGRSIPQALFDVGRRAPDELRPAFEAAHREWLLTTDFERTLQVLKHHLADPTADAACETLLIAHDVGGSDLGPRLEALAEDRRLEATSRKDARAKQAGVRFGDGPLPGVSASRSHPPTHARGGGITSLQVPA